MNRYGVAENGEKEKEKEGVKLKLGAINWLHVDYVHVMNV